MKPTWSIFPKFYRHMDLPELAGMVREVGLDTTNLVIRDGYWVTPDNLADGTRKFVQAMEKEGLTIHFATAGFSPEALLKDDTPLAVLADNGITEFRTDYFRQQTDDIPGALDAARNQLERLVPICERHGIRAVYQVHHGTLITNSLAAWLLVRELPPKWVGVMLDPGNQTREGFEDWHRAALLLRDHWVALGVKDSAWHRDPSAAHEPRKGWRCDFVPLRDGIIDWHKVAAALRSIDFDGTFVFMPFHDEHDPAAMTRHLKSDVAYLRSIMDPA